MPRDSRIVTVALLLATGLQLSCQAHGIDREIETPIGGITTEVGTPTAESTARLYDELDLRNAITAYIWGIPAAGNASWRHDWETVFGAEYGQFVALTTLQDRRGVMTPNNVASTPLTFPHGQ